MIPRSLIAADRRHHTCLRDATGARRAAAPVQTAGTTCGLPGSPKSARRRPVSAICAAVSCAGPAGHASGKRPHRFPISSSLFTAPRPFHGGGIGDHGRVLLRARGQRRRLLSPLLNELAFVLGVMLCCCLPLQRAVVLSCRAHACI